MAPSTIKKGLLRRLKNNSDFLRYRLPRFMSRKTKKLTDIVRLVNKLNKSELTCLCEIVHNLMCGNIPVDTTTKELLRPYKTELKQLQQTSKPKVKFVRSVLKQCGNGILPILISTVLPMIIELIRRK